MFGGRALRAGTAILIANTRQDFWLFRVAVADGRSLWADRPGLGSRFTRSPCIQ